MPGPAVATGGSSCARRLKKQIAIRLDPATVDYFKGLADETGLPCQNLINLFLRDCAQRKRKPVVHWPPTRRS